MTNDEYKEADAVFWEAYKRFQGAIAAEFGVTEASEQAAIVITNKLAAVRDEYPGTPEAVNALVKAAEEALTQMNPMETSQVRASKELKAALAALKK